MVARLGALAAGIAMGKSGIGVVREDEFLEVLTPGRLAARKLASRGQAAERVEGWRRAGHRVGFLAASTATGEPQAAAPGARLVRPAGDRHGRRRPGGAGAWPSMPTVDLVIRYGTETAVDLIRLLRPDVLVQDPGRAPETVAGDDIMQEWGGTVRRAVPEPDRASDHRRLRPRRQGCAAAGAQLQPGAKRSARGGPCPHSSGAP